MVLYEISMGRRERIEEAMARAGFNSQEEIAQAIGVKQPTISALLSEKFPLLDVLQRVAEKTSVSYEWLRYGDADKAPAWVRTEEPERPRVREIGVTYPAHQITMVGRVVAGDGQLSDESAIELEGLPGLTIPDTWQAVMVEGMSAYPVVYPGQIVLIDTARAARPESSTWNDAVATDLHDNLVLIETDEPAEIGKATSGHRAYLKRFCVDRRAPHGFVLASIDSGRSSPYVPADHILMIVPVVGVLYQDPRRPREKRWHAKTVVATVHP